MNIYLAVLIAVIAFVLIYPYLLLFIGDFTFTLEIRRKK